MSTSPLSPSQEKEFISDIILVCDKHGIKLVSPYTLTNLCEDVILQHDKVCPFFYGNEPDYQSLNPVVEAKKVLGIK